MLASFTSFAHLSTSARIVAAKDSGVEFFGSTPGHWAGQAFVDDEILFSGGSSNGGFLV